MDSLRVVFKALDNDGSHMCVHTHPRRAVGAVVPVAVLQDTPRRLAQQPPDQSVRRLGSQPVEHLRTAVELRVNPLAHSMLQPDTSGP